jgi:hypothetical protein
VPVGKIEIRGEQFPVQKVFSDDFAFMVPSYQRPYAWTTEHASELADDLLQFLGTGKTPVEGLNPYFLGSIVLIKGDDPLAQIVDGQQRLTTLTILLAVLRAHVPAEYARAITPFLYEQGNPLTGAPNRYRLRLRDRDAAFFQEFIQDESDGIARLAALPSRGLNDSQRNIRDNAQVLVERVRGLAEAQRIRLAQFVVRRCLLVVVSTPDLDSAYRIFSVLNDRGLDLSYADILKAEIIGNVPVEAQAEYTAKWEDAEESLGRLDFQALFSHIRAIYRKARPKETVLKEFRQYVIEAVGDPRRLIDGTLLPYAGAYHTVVNAAYINVRGSEQINELLRWLNRVDNADWIPPAMLYLTRHGDDHERLLRFLADLERLAASMMLRRLFGNRRAERYNRLLQAIEQRDDLFDPASPLQLQPGERQATLEILSGDFYEQSARPRQYVLLRLDRALAGTEAVYAYPTITIEHVLPQRPPSNSIWTRWFPTPELRETYVHRLGNLVLLSRTKNAQAANYDFEQKKRTYFSSPGGVSPFALTTQVLQEREWTPKVVERRQAELLQRLKDLWRL